MRGDVYVFLSLFLLSCYNKRPSYTYFDFIIEEPFNHIFTEKVSHWAAYLFLEVRIPFASAIPI